jgi:hypothetical protein
VTPEESAAAPLPIARTPRRVRLVASAAASPSIIAAFRLAADRWRTSLASSCPIDVSFEVDPTWREVAPSDGWDPDACPRPGAIALAEEAPSYDRAQGGNGSASAGCGHAEVQDAEHEYGSSSEVEAWMAAHELGHAFGLDHDARAPAVMNPTPAVGVPTEQDVLDYAAVWCPGFVVR